MPGIFCHGGPPRVRATELVLVQSNRAKAPRPNRRSWKHLDFYDSGVSGRRASPAQASSIRERALDEKHGLPSVTDVPKAISDDVQTLLRDHVGTYEKLHVLLFLRRGAERSWSVRAIAEDLRMRPEDVEDAVSALTKANLVSASGDAYAFQPGDRADAVARLSQTFEEQPLAVMTFLTTNAVDRIRTGALRIFANAFVFKGTKKDG